LKYLETNSISENITKDNINASVKKLCDIFVESYNIIQAVTYNQSKAAAFLIKIDNRL
jgi:hypothetical protein